jgi:hypothetical protein
MAIAAATVWEVRTTGDDTNGGGYSSGGTDYSQQDAPQLSLTDVVANGTTTLTSATGGFTAAMIGNLICLEGGTGALARTRRQITGFTNTNTITVDATVASGNTITGKVGGALASPGEAGRNLATQNDVYIKAGTYSISSNSQNVSGGKLAPPLGDATNYTRIIGYETTRGDHLTGGARPLLDLAVAGTNAVIDLQGRCIVTHIEVDLNATANAVAIRASSRNQAYCIDCKVTAGGSGVAGISLDGSANFVFGCEASGCAGAAGINIGGNRTTALGCYSHDNASDGFEVSSSGCSFEYCISDGNTACGFLDVSGANYSHCVAYGNGSHGFSMPTLATSIYLNCLSVGNTGSGFHIASTQEENLLINCAGYNNTGGSYDASRISAQQIFSFVALTGDPFIDAASDNFTLKNTGAGKELMSAGAPVTYPGNSDTKGKPTPGGNPKGGGGDTPGTPPTIGSTGASSAGWPLNND